MVKNISPTLDHLISQTPYEVCVTIPHREFNSEKTQAQRG